MSTLYDGAHRGKFFIYGSVLLFFVFCMALPRATHAQDITISTNTFWKTQNDIDTKGTIDNLIINSGVTLEIGGGGQTVPMELNVRKTLTVNGTLKIVGDNNNAHVINTDGLIVNGTGKITADGTGNPSATGAGKGTTSTQGSGAGYGGEGQEMPQGHGVVSAGGKTYGSSFAPTALGSGGGASCGGGGKGGAGGGGIIMNITNTAVLHGNISASGGNGLSASCNAANQGSFVRGGGGGSGGSIYIRTVKLEGEGTFSALGGNAGARLTGQRPGSGGGGGRIAIYYEDKTGYTRNMNDASVAGGLGAGDPGQQGSIVFVKTDTNSATDDDVFFINSFHMRTADAVEYTFHDIVWQNTYVDFEDGTIYHFTSSGQVELNNSTIDGSQKVVNFDIPNGEMKVGSNAHIKVNTHIQGQSLTIDPNGSITADSDGFSGGVGPGKGTNGGSHGGFGTGGGFGGRGGTLSPEAGGITYGKSYSTSASYDQQIDFTDQEKGSGGGNVCGVTTTGGYGGGAVWIKVATLTNNGSINASGGDGGEARCANDPTERSGAGGGSGGSINVFTVVLKGAGNFTTRGGTGRNANGDGTGGGGGRISVHFDDKSGYTAPLTGSSVSGGAAPQQPGDPGSMVFIDDNLTGNTTEDDEVTFVQSFYFRLEDGLTQNFRNIFFEQANTQVDYAEPFNYTALGDTVFLKQSSINGTQKTWNVKATNGTVTLASNSGINVNTRIEAKNVDVQSGSAIDASIDGHASRNGPGAGKNGRPNTGETGAGAGFGGKGGDASTIITGGDPYAGTEEERKKPIAWGSGGGGPCGDSALGGSGGGNIQLDVRGTLTINGTVTSNGGPARAKRCTTSVTGHSGGGGSGGSISVYAAIARGQGKLLSQGGGPAVNNRPGGGGAGGRIAFCVDQNGEGPTPDFVKEEDFFVNGGTGVNNGGLGDVYFCEANYLEEINDLRQWGWLGSYIRGEAIGWQGHVSTSCKNTNANCDTRHDYNVQAKLTAGQKVGDFSGYMWIGEGESDVGQTPYSIGFIDMDPTPFINGDPVKVGRDGKMYGFARFFVDPDEANEVNDPDWGQVRFGNLQNAAEQSEPWPYWGKMDWTNGEFSGWAWMGGSRENMQGIDQETSGFGLLSLTCQQAGRDTCADVAYGVKADIASPNDLVNVTGSAWFGGLGEGSVGWIQFSGPNYGVQLQKSTGLLRGSAWVGTITAQGEQSVGWLRFGDEAARYPTDPQISASFKVMDNDPNIALAYGWALISSIYKEGDEQHGYGDWGWVKLGDEPTAADWDPIAKKDLRRYGVRLQLDTMKLRGYAWNGGTLDSQEQLSDTGLGFLSFDEYVEAQGSPFLQTRAGDVYAGGGLNLTNPAPVSTTNATYLILSNGSITNFTTQGLVNEGGQSPDFVDEATIIAGLAKTGQTYSSPLGKIYLDALTEKNNLGKNIYGNAVETIGPAFSGDVTLDGRVLVSDGDLNIDAPLNFKNGSNATVDGSGVILVKGNLTLNANAFYEATNNGSLNHLRNLASVVWLVEGNILIKGNVTGADGAFIALKGENGTTGNITIEASNEKLVTKGLMMAKSFSFGRTYAASGEPSELIVYDGRLIANPPTGLQNFSFALPDIRRVAR